MKGGDQLGRGDGIADPRPGKAVGFGEGPHPDHPWVIGGKRGRGALGGAFDIGFIQQQQAALGQVVERACQCRALMPSAHRVVGIGEVDELGVHLRRFGEKRRRVFVIVAVGHFVQHAAKACDMVVEGRVGSFGGHHRVAFAHQ